MAVFKQIAAHIRRFPACDRAVAAVEAGLIFPLLVTLLMGVVDMGVGLLVNQKMITACQTVADILGREVNVDDDMLDEAFAAGRLSLMPYDTGSFGVDIAGIQFSGASATPVVRWRRSFNTPANDTILARANGLGLRDEGVLGVTATYDYRPFFIGGVIGEFEMREVAYVRGRRGLFITYEN